jgi:hypothetical protein
VVEGEMDEESKGGRTPSSIKPPMIKPPMAAPSYAEPPRVSSAPSQSPATDAVGSNKLIVVINIILFIALIVGLAILAYRWLR